MILVDITPHSHDSRCSVECTLVASLLSQTKGRYTLDIFAHNIAIKRYCDKKILR